MSQIRKILVVDDADDLRRTLTEQLALHEEFSISEANNASSALGMVRQDPPDMVIMDIGLPDMDGREAVKILRKDGYKNPIIMLTGQTSEADTVLGLDSGANDYINKPFRFAVLLARIRAHMRQHESSNDVVFQIGPYVFKPGSKMLVNSAGQKVRLTEKETAIIRFLHRANPDVVSRETLLREVWGYNANVTTHTLETHIYRLRQKIERDPSNVRTLITEAGGYRLVL